MMQWFGETVIKHSCALNVGSNKLERLFLSAFYPSLIFESKVRRRTKKNVSKKFEAAFKNSFNLIFSFFSILNLKFK